MSDSLPVIGIIGGGQLARMLYAASIRLGLSVKILAEGPEVSAALVGADVTVGDYTDADTVFAFAAGCDVITFDHEHVPPELLRALQEQGKAVRPGPEALIHAQDKAVMRERLSGAGYPCPQWAIVESPEALAAWGDDHGWPFIAKVSRGGYDGHGVWKIDGPDGCAEPFEERREDAVVVAEEFVDFARELSVLAVRSPSGQAMCYPASETVQQDGICLETTTPAPDLSADEQSSLQQLALRLADELGVVGVLAVELMQRRDGQVVINELAMRPHNTGHWSIDGAYTSQFENHLRAVADLPLGDGACREPWTVMENVLGGERNGFPDELLHVFAHDPRLKLEWYGKEHRAGRKLGHVTATGSDLASTQRRAREGAAYLRGEGA